MRFRRFAVSTVPALALLLDLGCNDEQPVCPGDTTPPAAITDLLASEPTVTSITLTWTAPGDDGARGWAFRYDLRRSTTPITTANWEQATPIREVQLPSAPGVAETLVVHGLCCGETRHFALRTADEVPNWSALSNLASLGTLDILAPGPVYDLASGAVTDTTAALAWTAPGDDMATGTAAQYDIRYSLAPLDAGNWYAATPIPSPPTPSPAGTQEHLLVAGLERGRTYFLALRTADEVPNWSGLSNVIGLSTTYTARDAGDLIRELAASYRRRDYALFSNLPSSDLEGAPYFFFLNKPAPGGETSWDRTEELRIERRMFDPEHTPPGETPVPPELRLVAIDIQLTATSQWTERPDLYRSDTNPTGLDPARWRASEALYAALGFIRMAGATDYQFSGRQNFVVIEDLPKAAGQDRKFLLYRWEDLGATGGVKVSAEEATWTSIKRLYR